MNKFPPTIKSVEIYVAAFLARCKMVRRPGQPEVDEPGVHGLLAAIDDPVIRLLVTDDRAYDVIAALLPNARAGMISVFDEAERCTAVAARHLATWMPDEVSAMVCRDLEAVSALPVPSELTLRPVRRLPDDPPDGVPLDDAVAAAMLAAPAIKNPPDAFRDYLRSLPSAIRLFAAVDGHGAVRATSGAGAFGTEATVMFVNTVPGWRGRGIGQAMAAAALRAARASGARRACLDASDAGARIYLRLGFETVTRTTRFFHRA